MTGEGSQANIVQASVGLGHSLQLESVAEGVEDAPTWELLGALGCDLAQGYLISRPMLADEVLPWLAQWKKGPAPSPHPAARLTIYPPRSPAEAGWVPNLG